MPNHDVAVTFQNISLKYAINILICTKLIRKIHNHNYKMTGVKSTQKMKKKVAKNK